MQDWQSNFPRLFKRGNVGWVYVPEGWMDEILNLCNDLEHMLEEIKDSPDIYVLQIKEKFGGMVFHMAGAYPEMQERIRESTSKSICQTCGKKGKLLYIKGLYITLCGKCEQNLEDDK